jgi:tight adherence protein C
MLLLAICGTVFAAFAFIVIAVTMEARSRQMSDRFTTLVRDEAPADVPLDLRGSVRERLIAPVLRKLNEFALRLTPKASVKALVLQLERAGRPWGMTPSMWSLLRAACAFAGIMAGLLAVKQFTIPVLRVCVLGGVAAAGVMGPSMMLDSRIKRRRMDVRRALPDVIDLLVVSVEAGLGLDAAVQEVIQRRRGPLVEELGRVLGEVRVGKSRRAAWQDMARRADVLELKGLVAALVQGEELGASVSGVLRGQAGAIRERRSIHVREMAAVLPVKMLFPLVFFIFPGMFVVILGPGMISMLTTFKSVGF